MILGFEFYLEWIIILNSLYLFRRQPSFLPDVADEESLQSDAFEVSFSPIMGCEDDRLAW